MEFDLENPLTGLEEHQCDTIQALFASESDHMPCKGYLRSCSTKDLNISVRREAISSIFQAQFSCNFDPFVSYLAVNYFDRFISRQSMPEAKPWILKLLAISCLSLAAKMKKSEFSLTDFQGDEGVIFDSQTIHRTELIILDALKWRMRSVTPFSFVQFFLSFFNLKDPSLVQSLKARATEILFKAQNEIKLLEFKPSITAASALLYASHELFPLQFLCFRKAISTCAYVNKDKLLDCCNVMEEVVVMMDGCNEVMEFDTLSCSDTPSNVLDRHYWTSESERTSTRAVLTSNRDVKRRKISGISCDTSVQLSQF